MVYDISAVGRKSKAARISRQRSREALACLVQINKVHLFSKDFDHEDGEVTATMKERRDKVFELYVDGLYA